MRALRSRWPFVLLAVLALAVRLRGIGWGLPELYEEAYPLKVAWGLWTSGPHGTFTWNPHFFRYPSLTIYLQFAGQMVLYAALALAGRVHSLLDFRALIAADDSLFVLTARTLTALFGAATAPLTYAVTERVLAPPRGAGPADPARTRWVRGSAWTAGLLVALHPGLALKSQEIEVDVPLAFFVALAAWCALGLVERVTWRACIMAGCVAGLAASTKYPGAIVLVPCVIALWGAEDKALGGLVQRPPEPATRAKRRGGRGRGPQSPRPAEPRPGGTARWLAFGLVVVAAAAAFLVTSPYVLLDRSSFLADLGAEREHMRFGHFGAGGGPAWGYYAATWMSHAAGWPLGIVTVVAIVAAFVRRRPKTLALALMVVIYYMTIGSWSMKADRYLIPLIPIAVALACATMAEALARVPALSSRAAVAAATWTLFFVACAAPTLADWKMIGERSKPDPRTLAKRWIEANVPEGAMIVYEPYGPSLIGPTNLLLMDSGVVKRLGGTPHRPRAYATLSMPMFQVDAARSAPFYDLGLYPAVDLFVITGSVKDRYRADTAAFAPQLAFYSALDRTFIRMASFGDAAAASDIVIYRRPDSGPWFGARDSVPSPGDYRGHATGGENYFFWNMGLDYECTGRHDQAIECYRRGLRYAPSQLVTYRALAVCLGHCLLATRSPEESMRYLDEISKTADSRERAAYGWIRQQIVAGGGVLRDAAVPRLGPIGG